MGRREYKIIAEVIRRQQGITEDQRMALAYSMASALHSTNRNFDEHRFIDACDPRLIARVSSR